MCLAVPSEIVALKDKIATIDVSGVRREVSLLLLPEEAAVGDYVLVHAGFAIQKIDRQAAEDALKLIEEIAQLEEDSSQDTENRIKAEPYL
ncbi:MAG: HypC/HybG/HupF family hydrogenase formation chaperone [Thermodesulfobacteriota bacterium]|nr:HypC/HybG/HupF family hydrogenase formation chaperone [Thermodesulfobacteriota bacterium]